MGDSLFHTLVVCLIGEGGAGPAPPAIPYFRNRSMILMIPPVAADLIFPSLS